MQTMQKSNISTIEISIYNQLSFSYVISRILQQGSYEEAHGRAQDHQSNGFAKGS
jgi:hypothetical protein